jgi:hypothetical protein
MWWPCIIACEFAEPESLGLLCLGMSEGTHFWGLCDMEDLVAKLHAVIVTIDADIL